MRQVTWRLITKIETHTSNRAIAWEVQMRKHEFGYVQYGYHECWCEVRYGLEWAIDDPFSTWIVPGTYQEF